MDFSGTTDSGERVMGVVQSGAVRSRLRAQPELLWPVPAHWSLEDAATVPLPYAHAFYCLGIKCQLIRGMSVLVHGGTGALGQAVISIALANGCEVFTTVSDIRKKHFLRKLFPELKDDHIGNSRDHSFGDMVLNATKRKGCNIIISCVKGELRNTTLNCSASMGITFDTIQIPSQEKFAYGMHFLTEERSYIPLDFSSIFTYQNSKEMKEIQEMLSEGISRGYVRPLSRVTYAPLDAPRAFRLLAATRHRGRVLLRLRDPVLPAQPRLNCSPDHTQLVFCDKENLGLQFADRLVQRGAKKLHLHCPASIPHLQLKIQFWQKLGVQVKISSNDLNDNEGIINILKESKRSSPVEGLYTITDNDLDSSVQKWSSFLTKLDIASRKLCPNLKYFAVVTVGNTVGQQTCLSRVRDRLPATMLHLPGLKKDDDVDNQGSLSWRSAVDAVEQALLSSQPIISAHTHHISRLPLAQQIAIIADVQVSEDSGDVTLHNLGMEYEKSQIISAFLRDYHNISLNEEQIPLLTINKITSIEEMLTNTDFKEVKGLETFFSFVDPDELQATTEMLFLPTLTHHATVGENEFDVTETYLCIVPGMEGHYDRFRTLCERLKLPALILQPGLDRLNETIQEMAQRYTKVLLKKAKLQNNFYLLGYESGVMVALEIAAILEDHGLTGTVFCVGCAPDELQAVIEEQLTGIDTEEALQDAVARHMSSLMGGDTSEQFENALRNASSWKEKIEACVRTLLGRMPHSAQYARMLIEAAHARIKQARQYSEEPRCFRSLLVFLHANNQSVDSARASLQRYSQQPIKVHELRAPLAYATNDLRCGSVINQYLSPNILEAFEMKNVCETYVVNTDTFMSHELLACDER